MEKVPTRLLQSLIFIFNGDPSCQRFYQRHGVAPDEPCPDGPFSQRPVSYGVGKGYSSKNFLNPLFVSFVNAQANEKDAKHGAKAMLLTPLPSPSAAIRTSVHLINNINYFGQKGGFEALSLAMNRIPANLQTLRLGLGIMTIIREYLRPQFLKEFLPRFTSACETAICDIHRDDLKSLQRDALSVLVEDVALMFATQHQSSDNDDAMDDTANEKKITSPHYRIHLVLLHLCRQLIACKYLPQRLLGINRLVDVINSVERGGYSIQTREFRRSDMLEFLSKHKILDELLEDPHHEVLRRLPTVMAFISRHDELNDSHILRLWEAGAAASHKHEALIRSTYSVLAALATHLSRKQLELIYKKITEIKFSTYQMYTLDFVARFTDRAIQRIQLLLRRRRQDKRGQSIYSPRPRDEYYTKDPAQEEVSLSAGAAERWFGIELFWKMLVNDDAPVGTVDRLPRSWIPIAHVSLVKQMRLGFCICQ